MRVCPYCRKTYQSDSRFCPNCGRKLPADRKPSAPAKPKQRKKWPWVLAIVIVVLGALTAAGIFGIPLLQEQIRISHYNAGADALAAKDYNTAAKEFSAAGDYSDAPHLLQYAREGAALDNARNLAAQGYEYAAMQILETIPDFPGAADYLEELRTAEEPEKTEQELQYEAAVRCYEQGSFEAALGLFETLTGYADADAYIEKCRGEVATARADALLAEENYAEALALLESEDVGPYVRGREEKIAECKWLVSTLQLRQLVSDGDLAAAYDYLESENGQYIRDPELIKTVSEQGKFQKAQKLFDSGLFYSAYVLFSELGDYNHADERAAACVQPRPKNGELFRNEHYDEHTVRLVVTAPKEDTDTYLIIQTQTGDSVIPVSTIYLRSESTARVYLPAGTYVIARASGSGDWFGTTEMWGPDGIYEYVSNGNGGTEIAMQRNKEYRLRLEAHVSEPQEEAEPEQTDQP